MTPSAPVLFNKRLYARRRARAATSFDSHDFLHRRAMADIVDRLETIQRRFPLAVFDGAGALSAMVTPNCDIGAIISTEIAPERLDRSSCCFAGDPEALPLAPQSVSLFVSLLTLHTANDLVGALTQARMALKPDGLFVAAVFGEATLSRLRQAFYLAETEITGEVSSRFAPVAAIQDYGAALQRAGFALPVVDIDKIEVAYSEPMNLLRDLRGMGETQVLMTKSRPLRRDVVARALQVFAQAGGKENFEIIYLTGWAPHDSQQKPLRPGSGEISLKDAIKGAS